MDRQEPSPSCYRTSYYREYYKQNREKIKAYYHKYYQEYRKQNREKLSEYQRLYRLNYGSQPIPLSIEEQDIKIIKAPITIYFS